MNDIIDKFLLVADKFMPEMHLRQPGFTYSACGPFKKNKERIVKFMKTGNTDFIYKNELDKACFQHNMAYGKSKDLVRRTQSNKVLRDKEFKIACDPKYDGYQRELALMVYKSFEKKSRGSDVINESNYQLANELHKPIIKKFKKRKVYSSFRDNIWGVDLADVQSFRRYNKVVKHLLCTTDLFSKYAWVVPIKNKKGTRTVNAFKEKISKGRKPNKKWIDQGSEFYNQSFKDFLKINNIEMYSTFNEGKSVVAEIFIKKVFKHMTAISKNVYFDVLNDIMNKCNNTIHRTIKTKPIDVTDGSFAEYNEEFNKKDPKFKVGDHVRISKYKNIFAKGYISNWSEEVFIVNKIRNTVPWTYTTSDLNGEQIIGGFYEKEFQKTNQKEFRIEQVVKRKGDQLYVKWKGYDNSFNSWINKRRSLIKMSQYFPKPSNHEENFKLKLI